MVARGHFVSVSISLEHPVVLDRYSHSRTIVYPFQHFMRHKYCFQRKKEEILLFPALVLNIFISDTFEPNCVLRNLMITWCFMKLSTRICLPNKNFAADESQNLLRVPNI